MSNIVKHFKEKTDKLFSKIDGYSARELEQMIRERIQDMVEEYSLDVIIDEVVLSGSRSRGLENKDSDLDFVVLFSGLVREDVLFDILNAQHYTIGGVEVDINPIKENKSGSLEDYLINVEKYFANQKEESKKNNINNNRHCSEKV